VKSALISGRYDWIPQSILCISIPYLLIRLATLS